MSSQKKFVGAMPSGTKITLNKITYRVLETLGQGGFGITYKVARLTDGMIFAMKEYYRKDLCQRNPDDTIFYFDTNKDTIETGLKDFTTEAQRLGRQHISHPNIVAINEVFKANNTAYYLMEFIQGDNLLQYMQRRKNAPLGVDEALNIMRPVFQAVALLHSQKITHYDIKHENILLTKNGDGSLRPVLIDFGLSKHYDKNGKATSTLTGPGCSEGFAPPEQYQGLTKFTPQADVYALAATLLYLLSGKWPVKSMDITARRILDMLPESVPHPIKNAIVKAMRKELTDRTQSVEEFARDLGLDLQVHPTGKETEIITPGRNPENNDTDHTFVPTPNPKPNPKWLKPAIFGAAALLVAVLLFNHFGNPSPDSSFEEVNYTVYSSGGKKGYQDENENIIIPAKYDDAASSFSEGLAPVKVDDKWGFIDKNDNMVIPAKYDYACSFSEGLAEVEVDDKWGFIDKNDNMVIPAKYDDAWEFSEGLAAVKVNGKWGFIDKNDSMVIPAKYDDISSFSESLAMANVNGKWGFIDKNDNMVIPAKYSWVTTFTEGLAPVTVNGKYGFIDKNDSMMISAKYDEITRFSEGLAGVMVNNKWGFIDKNDNMVIPAKYDWIWTFSEGLAQVKVNGKYGFINKNGIMVIPPKYDDAFFEFSEGKIKAKLNGRWFYIDKNGNEVK